MASYKFVVVCKGSVDVGLGHLFRAKTFAKFLKQEGYDFTLIAITDKYVRNVLNGLHNDTHFVSHDTEAAEYILKNSFDVVVFDSISFAKEYILSIKKKVKHVASISPVFDSMKYVDSLFTRLNNFDSTKSSFTVYSGLEYIILNDTVKPISNNQYEENMNNEPFSVGITMGGADSSNNTKKVIKALNSVRHPLTIWTLLGEGYNHSYTELAEIIKKDKKHEVILARTNQNMWKLLGNCTLAITSGGLTYNEAVYAGLPVINLFESSEHAKRIPDIFTIDEIGFNMGAITDENLNKTVSLINNLINEPESLFNMRRRMKGKIDGKAPDRIIKAIVSNLERY